MNLLFPDNIFTRLLYNQLDVEHKKMVQFHPTSIISSKLNESKDNIGLISSADIIQHKDFFISKKNGISFEGEVSNSFLYFVKGKELSELYLHGDVSSLEVIFSKIFFKEVYDIDVQIHLSSNLNELKDKTMLVIGDLNYTDGMFSKGMSFGGEIVDMLALPYVNFVFASNNEELLIDFTKTISGLEENIYSSIEKDEFKIHFAGESNSFLKENLHNVIYDFNEQDVEGVTQLIRLPYYYGIAPDIIDIKWV